MFLQTFMMQAETLFNLLIFFHQQDDQHLSLGLITRKAITYLEECVELADKEILSSSEVVSGGNA